MSAQNDIRDYILANISIMNKTWQDYIDFLWADKPVEDWATKLPTGGIYLGEVQDNNLITDNAIFVRGYSSREPERTFSTREVRYYKVQILIRSLSEDYNLSEKIGENLFELLQSSTINGLYLDCKAMQSNFVEFGEDTKKRLIWICNFELRKQIN